MSENLKAIVQLLKPFDGNSQYLEYFITNINEFHQTYFTGEIAQKEFVVTAIKSKLINDAGNFLMSKPELKTWEDIREALRLKYGCPYSRQNLVQELMYTNRTKNESIMDYLDKLKNLMSKITTKIMCDRSLLPVVDVLISKNEIIAIQNLVTNSPTELRTILMVQNPLTLDEATTLVLNYQLAENHMKFSKGFSNNTNNNTNTHSNFKKINNNPQSSFTQQKSNFAQNQFPSQPINIQSKPNYQHKFPTTSGTFGKNYKNFNAFKKNSNQNFQKPTPMSGVSVQPKKPYTNNYFKPNPNAGPQRYTIEEINNIYELELPDPKEISEQNENFEYFSEENLEESQENPENENFPLEASETNQP